MIMFSWFTSRFSLLCFFLLSNVLASYLGRTNALLLDESVDWWPFGLPFALILGHLVLVLLSPVFLFVPFVTFCWGRVRFPEVLVHTHLR